MEDKIAYLIKKNLPNFNGVAHLYRLDPPLKDYERGSENIFYEYVVVSATVVIYTGAETYIFGADKEGNIVNWSDLPGSCRGTLNHEEVLRDAGYDTFVEEKRIA